ncbi:hypothetical protein ACIQXM_02040 [Arthrobacter sp. NPDC097144]|uniref:hypothetical protein n=1 Tax=Arthrobacter sp. NPDC097144 TaxID=3363946 RepID=UPI0038287812
MRDVPGWPSSTDVLEPIVRVTHKGAARDVDGVTISRSLPSTLHAQVARVGGLTQATGKVDWSSRTDVETARATGFNRTNSWPPAVRDKVDISTGYRTESGDLLVRQLTGSVLSGNGDPQGSTESELVDPIARLSRTVNLPPLLNNMPPLTDGGTWRGVGLYPTFFTDKAARAGSFNSTPGMANGCVFSAPLMGSAWPERGTLVTGLRYTDRNNANAIWQETPWGLGASDTLLIYKPSGTTTLDRPMEITAMAPGRPDARSVVEAGWAGAEIGLEFRSGKVCGTRDGVTVCELPYADGHVFTLRVLPSGSTLQYTLRDAVGREATGSTGKPTATNSAMAEVRVASTAAGALIGGAQVAFPSTAWASVGYTRSAFITPSTYNGTLAASPPIQDETARSLLEAQATAELAGLWIDGDGALHWVNRLRLTGAAPVATLTSKDNLLSLPWEEDFAAVSSVVTVTSRSPEAIMQSKYPLHEVWRSSYSKVNADGTEIFEELLHPDTDEDWIMVDTRFDNDYADANNMRGSDVAVYYFFENDLEPGQGGSVSSEGYQRAWVGATLRFIDHRTYKLTTTVYAVSTPAWDEYEFSLQIPTEHQSVSGGGWQANLGGMNFPVIRAYGKVMWTDVTYSADAGTWDAPALSHDVGWWVQDAGECQAIANYLARNTTTAQPFLSAVSIIPDARLERGDVVTLVDPDLTGIEYRCLVVGIEDRISGSPLTWDQTCDFRVIDYKAVA